jgi:fatty-acyl-CoA synthase
MRWLDRTFADALAWGAATYRDAPAFICGDVRTGYAELAERADAFAAGLLAHGITAGDKVGLWLPDCLEWIVARWAIPSIGAILVPINTRFRDVDLRYVLQQSDCRALIMQARHRNVDYRSILDAATSGWAPRDPASRPESMPFLSTLIGVGAGLPEGAIAFDDVSRRGASVPRAGLDAARRGLSPTDVAQILYTSGTTSFPKGAMVRHGALLENNFNNAARMRFGPDDRFLASAPLFSATGTSYAIYSFLSGAAIVVGDGFTPESFCQLVERERITATFFVEPMVHDLKNFAGRFAYSLGTLRTGTGSPLSAASFRWIVEELGLSDFTAAYGLSESSNAVVRSDWNEPLEDKIATCGLPMPGIELRIDDLATGSPVGPGLIGEIRIRGFNVMAGYYRMPEQTARAIDAEGWLHTGDLGELRADGRLVYRGRLKEMIKPSGFNVATLEVEEFIKTIAGVREVALVGVPDERTGEAGYAFVELHPGAELDAQRIIAHCRQHIASYKVPREVEFVTEWPRTSTGKLQKLALKERAAKASASAKASPSAVSTASASQRRSAAG